jgi:hypothetical protein
MRAPSRKRSGGYRRTLLNAGSELSACGDVCEHGRTRANTSQRSSKPQALTVSHCADRLVNIYDWRQTGWMRGDDSAEDALPHLLKVTFLPFQATGYHA